MKTGSSAKYRKSDAPLSPLPTRRKKGRWLGNKDIAPFGLLTCRKRPSFLYLAVTDRPMLTVITCCMYLTSSFTSQEPLDQWCSSTTRLCQDVEALESTIPSSGLGGRATPSVARTSVIWDKYFGMSVLHPLKYCKHTTIPMFLMRRADHPLRATTVARE